MEQIIYIILGWLLGLLSPEIINRISNSYRKDKVRKTIINDLKGLKKRIAPLPWLILPKYNQLTLEDFEWLIKNDPEVYQKHVEAFADQNISKEDLVHHFNTEGVRKNTKPYIKKNNLFALDSNLSNITLLDDEFVSGILEVKFKLESFNEDIQYYRENLKMTFDSSISAHNHEIISDGLDSQVLWIARQAIGIVDKINDLLEEHDKSKEQRII